MKKVYIKPAAEVVVLSADENLMQEDAIMSVIKGNLPDPLEED